MAKAKQTSSVGELILERPNKKIYKDGTNIIKVFNHELVSKSTVLFEALNQSYIEETKLNVPHVNGIYAVDGDWAISQNYIEGETLQQKIERDPSNKAKYIDTLVKLQLEVLSNHVPQLVKLKNKLNNKISFCGKEEAKVKLEATLRYDLHVALERMPNHDKLCHGDFVPSNIVCASDGKFYILDWAHACRGNASADAARTYLDFVLNGDEEGANLYLNTFAKKADIAKQYIQSWFSVVAATLLNSQNDPKKIEILKANINSTEGF